MEFTSAMHSVSMTQIHWEKELLDLVLKLGSHITVTLKPNIDSAACTNWEHPLGDQQSGLSCDLKHETLPGTESRKNIYPGHSFPRGQSQTGTKDQTCPFQKGWKYIYWKKQKIWTNKTQNLTRQELDTMKVKQLRQNIWHKSLPVSASLFVVQFSGSCWKHQV